jgi:hypothetical protein
LVQEDLASHQSLAQKSWKLTRVVIKNFHIEAQAGVLAAGVSSIPKIDSCLSPGFIPKNNLQPLSRGATKGLRRARRLRSHEWSRWSQERRGFLIWV